MLSMLNMLNILSMLNFNSYLLKYAFRIERKRIPTPNKKTTKLIANQKAIIIKLLQRFF
jgi:hypothetical protein